MSLSCRFFTDLPLLILMWPIRFVSFSQQFYIHFCLLRFYYHPIYSGYAWCMRWARTVEMYFTWIWICFHDTLLHMHMFEVFFFYFIVLCPFFILPNLFCVQHCVCSCHFIFRYSGYKCKTICNYVMADELCFVIRFPIHDTTALKFNFKPLFNFT